MNQSTINKKKRYYRWLRIAIHAALVLVCSSAAVLLGRLYYEKGGKSKWMGTLVQLAGFPILLPYYFFSASKNLSTNSIHQNQPSTTMLAFIYVSIGVLVALDCYLYSVGLWSLPVSTYSLICSSQLAFNAFFSYFLNSLKFTPYIINSLVLLTISSTLLVFQNDSSDSNQVSKKKYVIGFICTIGASAGYGLWLSLTQLVFKKVLKRETFKVVMDMIIYQSLVATCVTLVGLFASGEWSGLKNEMKEYEMGKASYLLNLTFTAILWQLFTIGCVGLIFEVSSLFSNAISVLGVPVVPMLAVMFFDDKMHGVKAMSMVLAIWGFVSYVYQQYLDDTKSENRNPSHVPKASSPLEEEVNR
ncbi:purine permease 21-like isoform X4 [Abrus precatorius]|nr:purine permease 21-like isoform X4 [Abrus precatorius]